MDSIITWAFATLVTLSSGQPAYYYQATEPNRPLLVGLHTWSGNYRQKMSIKYLNIAVRNNWNFIHPEFQTGGKKKDMIHIKAAIDFAKSGNIISEVVVAGMSGGGHAALQFLSHYPEVPDKVFSFGAPTSLLKWEKERAGTKYALDVLRVLGGVRSIERSNRLSPAKTLRKVSTNAETYIVHGLFDTSVDYSHAVNAFKALRRKGNNAYLHIVDKGHYDDSYFYFIEDALK